MRKLILIKHAKPKVVETVASYAWELSDEGKLACPPLAAVVARHDPTVIVTSDEAKAIQTGQLVGEAINKPVAIEDGLHEHDRSNVGMMPSSQFLSLLALFFKERNRLVLGKETAEQACRRFAEAVDAVVKKSTVGNIAVVTHGTVLALFAAKHGGDDPFLLYRALALPSVVVFSIPDYAILERIDRI